MKHNLHISFLAGILISGSIFPVAFQEVGLFEGDIVLGAIACEIAAAGNISLPANPVSDDTDLSDRKDLSDPANLSDPADLSDSTELSDKKALSDSTDLPDSIPTTGDIYVARAVVIDGDTLWVADLDEIYIFPTKKFRNRWERRRYSRLIYNVKKAYPWAKMAGEKLEEVEVQMSTLKTEREQREYIKQVEEELLQDYKEDLKKLTLTQGRILIKLVDRETGDTSYELVEELRGKLSAFFWQALARLFGSNLKAEYDPYGDDRLIEQIVILIEAGQL